MKAFAEISEAGDRIDVHFPYDAQAVRAIKSVPGARFIPRDKGGPAWRLPLDLTSARRLREGFGEGLELGNALRAWGRKAVEQERNLKNLSNATDAKLTNLPKQLPELHEFLRDYQRADAAFMATASSINANQPGTGKTVATIAAIFEAGLGEGQHLIVAPVTSLRPVWEFELARWQPHPVLTGDTPDERREAIAEACELAEAGEPFFLVINPAMVAYQRNKRLDKVIIRGKSEYPTEAKYPELFKINWSTIVVDEYHKMGLANNKTLTYKAANDLKSERKYLLSGTPMGGKPIKLWGALHFIDPGSFTSKWRWADQWLVVEDNGYGKDIQGIASDREDEFYEALAPYLVRRTKSEVLKELPLKQYVDVLCPMETAQKKQYDTFAMNAELKIEEEHLTATGVLAEYTRLKQFANSKCKVETRADGKIKLVALPVSGKLPYLLERLEERGISATDPEGDAQAVVGSQFKETADMVHEWLNDQGIPAAKITGDTRQKERERIVAEFQTKSNGSPRVLVLTTTAGGVSITLDRADSVHILDETWNPDDQEQLEDRVHRASRIHQVTCYYYRSKDSIEEYIHNVTDNKMDINRMILDLRRQGFRAVKQEVSV